MKAIGKVPLLIAAVVAQVLITVAFVLLALHWGCERFDHVVLRIDAKQNRSFNSLRLGMRQADVFERMGMPPLSTSSTPIWSNSNFTLTQYEGNEQAYAKTNGVQAQVFYTWNNGDVLYCLGFGTNGLLVVKGKGGS